MDKVRILIVEDDILIAMGLKAMLQDLGFNVPAVFSSGREVLENFKPGYADIVMMDIQLKGKMNGVQTAMGLRELSNAPIIYLTDNEDEEIRKQAIYGANTVQYLTKPFTRLEIMTSIDLALKMMRDHELRMQEKSSASYLISDAIFVRDGHIFRKLPVGDIVLLKAEGSYCQLFYRTAGKPLQTFLFCENLSFVEEKLKFFDRLYRVHRSFVINVSFLEQLEDGRLWLAGMEIPVGKTYRAEVRKRFRYL